MGSYSGDEVHFFISEYGGRICHYEVLIGANSLWEKPTLVGQVLDIDI